MKCVVVDDGWTDAWLNEWLKGLRGFLFFFFRCLSASTPSSSMYVLISFRLTTYPLLDTSGCVPRTCIILS
jgi:hypothetical protein